VVTVFHDTLITVDFLINQDDISPHVIAAILTLIVTLITTRIVVFDRSGKTSKSAA